MTDKVVVHPVAMAVSLDDARAHARINGADNDSEIEIAVRRITVDAETVTQRAIVTQTRRLTLDWFGDALRLDRTPVITVSSIKYLDMNGLEQTLDPADYYCDLVSEPSYIVPAVGKAWPATLNHVNAVNVTYVCGYGPNHTTTPPAFKGYILARVREYFAPAGTPESPFLIRGLDSLKVYS